VKREEREVKRVKTAILFLIFCLAPLMAEDPAPDEEPVINEEALSGEETPIDEMSAGETPFHDDEPSLPDDEPLVSEDFDGAYIFEAPPLIFENVPFAGIRSFDEIYPKMSRRLRRDVMSDEGGLRNAFEKDESPRLLPDPDSGIDLYGKVMKRKPSHIIESLVLVPYTERELDLLDIYNALGRIKEIQDQEVMFNDRNINSFLETTRLNNPKNRRAIPDPPPRDTLPYSEVLYVRFVDRYIGDLYIKGEITFSLYGVTYDMTNFRDVTFSLFSIMKAERFSAIIYLEPIKEGVLIYSMSGIYLPGFIVSRVNLTPNMNRHIMVLLSWILEGLERESKRQKPHFYQIPPGAGH